MIQRRTAEAFGVLLFPFVRAPQSGLGAVCKLQRNSGTPHMRVSAAIDLVCRGHRPTGRWSSHNAADGLDGADLSFLSHIWVS